MFYMNRKIKQFYYSLIAFVLIIAGFAVFIYRLAGDPLPEDRRFLMQSIKHTTMGSIYDTKGTLIGCGEDIGRERWNPEYAISLGNLMGPSVLLSHGEDALVAVAFGLRAPDDFGGGHVLLPDPRERVVDLLELEAQLLVIVHVTAVAAAAAAVAGAVGGGAGGGGDKQLFAAPVGEARAGLDDADLPDLARQRARHKDRAASQVRDARGVGGKALDRNSRDFIFSQRFHILYHNIYGRRRQNFLNNLAPNADTIFV